nr:ribonuclease H-like domain-containing protein [Tanacetum cinerariifolium]
MEDMLLLEETAKEGKSQDNVPLKLRDESLCEMKGILRQFSIARTPQQNGVAEKRNRTLIKTARTMLADSKLSTTFWAEAVNVAFYVQNKVLVVKPHNKTPYELFHGTKASDNAAQARKETEPIKDYILLPL